MAQRIQLRRGTAAEWTAANPVLAVGEPGVETDTGKQKFGDGVTPWNSRPYASKGDKGDQGIPGIADDTSVAQQVTNGTATKAALNATYVPKWKANTAYLAGDKVLSPSGDVVSAKANFTSGASYSAANWDLSATVAGKLDSSAAAATYRKGTIQMDALARGKRLRATTAGNRAVTAVGVTVGTITGGALSASGSAIPSAVRVNAYDRTNTRVNPALRVLGTRPVQAQTGYPRYDLIKPDPSIVTYAPGVLTGTSLKVDTSYAGSAIDVIIRRGGGTAPHIITVDGLVAATITDAALATAGVTNGDFGRVPLTFVDARPRVIGYSQATAASEFPGFDIAPAYPLAYPATLPKGPRVLISGDSFTEGTGSDGGFPYVQWVSWHMGWPDVWQGGSGSTGYVAAGTRTALINRYTNDLIAQAPDILVIAMGINDLSAYSTNPASVTSAAATIWDAVIAQLPATELIIVGPWSPKGGVYTDASLAAMDLALQAMAKARGLRFISPIQEGWITGNGKVGATTGNGNADIYTSNDGTHPSPAGHEYLGWRLAGHLSVPYLEA